MSGNNQEKMTKYLDFPFDTFLMLRFEYEVILEDELEVKLLRIIEYYIESERKQMYRNEVNRNGTPDQPLDITREIWVPISHRLFMSDLYGKVTSENTVKRAINSLIAKRIIFRRHEPKKRYDAPEYTINHAALQALLKMTRGYQFLIPSVIDTLRKLPPQILTPSEAQKLIPSEIDLSVESETRVSKIDTNFNNSNNNSNKHSITSRVNNTSASASSANAPDATHTLAQENEQLREELARLKAQMAQQQEQPATVNQSLTVQAEVTQPDEKPASDTDNTPSKQEASVSCSQQIAPTNEQESVRVRGSRKPRVAKEAKPKISAEENARIEAVFDCLDKLMRKALKEHTGEEVDFSFSRPQTDRAHVYELLSGRIVSPERAEKAFWKMWNSPVGKDGFSWKENFSVAAYCRHYDKMLIGAMSEKPAKAPAQPASNVTSLAERNRLMREKYGKSSDKTTLVAAKG